MIAAAPDTAFVGPMVDKNLLSAVALPFAADAFSMFCDESTELKLLKAQILAR